MQQRSVFLVKVNQADILRREVCNALATYNIVDCSNLKNYIASTMLKLYILYKY